MCRTNKILLDDGFRYLQWVFALDDAMGGSRKLYPDRSNPRLDLSPELSSPSEKANVLSARQR